MELVMTIELFSEDLKILSPKEIARILGVSLGTFHKIRKDEGFPPRRHFGAETRGWLMRDVREWALNRPEG
jgi:predicted DNA-binding transcriptional regulator AlpA